MSFSITNVGISEDGRLLVTLNKKSTGTNTQIWVKPTSPIPSLTIADIELLAKQEAAKEHTC
ncbi:hypothetical protein V466_28970 [Pseudomonas mandelii PD30]|uniref:Uncharacterized protein n=1 Tax=Pseudomonas mandelii PD30 TaxID=1419583 RepID=A0A059KTW1_9PSED|nr:hypothetical protein V466_28970 [Pseudomonas mandelii PD30]